MLSATFALLGQEACKGFVLPLRDVRVMVFITDAVTILEIFQKGQLYPGLADFMFAGKLWFKGPKADGPKDGWITGEKSTTAWVAKLLRMHV